MSPTPGPVKKLWYSWKMLRFPWRRRWLVGFDLEGNTFWEARDQLHALRARRIMKPGRWTHHGDVNPPPQWLQWLRHTRYEPPTLSELQEDVVRQERIKMLAARADERWAAKESALDAPDKQQPMQMLASRDPRSGITQMNTQVQNGEQVPPQSLPQSLPQSVPQSMPQSEPKGSGQAVVQPAAEPQVQEKGAIKKKKVMKKEPKDSPWKQAQQTNPSQDWQPQQWAPGPARRKSKRGQ